jgi:hypothetical protein
MLLNNDIDLTIVDLYIHQDELKNYEYLKQYNLNIYLHRLTELRFIRTYIALQYKQGSHILFLDDDIKDIGKKNNNKINWGASLKEMYELGFSECIKRNCSVWGITPYSNGFYMKNKMTENLKYIPMGCSGSIINHNCEMRSYSTIEDFERTIKYFLKDSKVLRLNMYCPKTKFYSIGGLNDLRSYELKKKDIENFTKKYPKLVKIKYKGQSPSCDKDKKQSPKDIDILFNYRAKSSIA